MTTARDTIIGSLYVRDEERAGKYFRRTESPVPSLERRNRNGGEETLLRKLLAGGVPFDRCDAFETDDGGAFAWNFPIALPPETPLRMIETPPAPRGDEVEPVATPEPEPEPEEDDWLDFIEELEPMVSGAANATRPAYLERLIGPMREPGVYTAEEMSNETYHESGALSSSGLKMVVRSIDHYVEKRRNPKVSTTFDVGTAVHDLVLEGGANFAELFVMRPEGDRGNFRKAEGKEWRDEQLAAGLRILDASQSEAIEASTDAIFAHPEARALLADGEAESSYFWEEVVAGVAIPCRVRLDLHHPNLIVDLKTTGRDASPEKFGKDTANYGYDSSLALYRRGVEVITGRAPEVVRVIVAETVAPYGVCVYDIDEQWLARGKAAYLEQLGIVARWLTSEPDEVWTGYPRGVIELPMPRWAKRWDT